MLGINPVYREILRKTVTLDQWYQDKPETQASTETSATCSLGQDQAHSLLVPTKRTSFTGLLL